MNYADIMTQAATKSNEKTRTYGQADSIYRNATVLAGMTKGKNVDLHETAMNLVAHKYAELIANPMVTDSYIDLINAVAIAATYTPSLDDLDEGIEKIAQMFGANAGAISEHQ